MRHAYSMVILVLLQALLINRRRSIISIASPVTSLRVGLERVKFLCFGFTIRTAAMERYTAPFHSCTHVAGDKPLGIKVGQLSQYKPVVVVPSLCGTL